MSLETAEKISILYVSFKKKKNVCDIDMLVTFAVSYVLLFL